MVYGLTKTLQITWTLWAGLVWWKCFKVYQRYGRLVWIGLPHNSKFPSWSTCWRCTTCSWHIETRTSLINSHEQMFKFTDFLLVSCYRTEKSCFLQNLNPVNTVKSFFAELPRSFNRKLSNYWRMYYWKIYWWASQLPGYNEYCSIPVLGH